LLGLAKFPWRHFVLGYCFWRYISKGENVGPKQAGVSKVGRGKLCVNIGREYQKGAKFDLGRVWMMVSIQASVSNSNFVNLCKFMLASLVLS
jgi:hypothetical protein